MSAASLIGRDEKRAGRGGLRERERQRGKARQTGRERRGDDSETDPALCLI